MMHSRRSSNPAHRPPSISVHHSSSHSRSSSVHHVFVHKLASPTTPTHGPVSAALLPLSTMPQRTKPTRTSMTRTSLKRVIARMLPRSGKRQATALVVCAFVAATFVLMCALAPQSRHRVTSMPFKSRTRATLNVAAAARTAATRTPTDSARDRSTTKSLPSCRKTMQFKMAGLHGFGSEFNLLVRAAALAQKYDYTLVPPDADHWNYGSFADYFDGPELDCQPPKDTYHRTSMTFPDDADRTRSQDSLPWLRKQHVMWSKRDMEGLDRTIVSAFTDREHIERLHESELERLEHAQKQPKSNRFIPPIVSTPELVPRAYRNVFQVQSELARSLWRPSLEIRAMVNQVAAHLGLGRSHQDQNDRRNRPREADDLVIGMHVRLGDKYLEQSGIGPQAYDEQAAANVEGAPSLKPGLHDETVELYLQAAIESVDSILAKLHPERTRKLSTAQSAWRGQPTLIVVSDDPRAYEAFRRQKLGKRFQIRNTPAPFALDKRNQGSSDTTETPIASASPEKTKAQKERERKWRLIKRRKLGGQDEPDGFNERSFNSMKLDDRIAHTKTFVRDLTLLASQSDALVLTASSNVGRLLMLLAGKQFVDEGLIRSVDTRWFPTSQFY
ncbi:hypothetical protein OIV83_006174 [Microbotryomycetes sp. JL201]|nr:hypothetical protein OIV83_006174 [Microbotryomycetes sp. JL201]